MGFNSLAPARLQYHATHSAGDFAGIARDNSEVCASFPELFATDSATYLDALHEERLAERIRIAQELHDTLLQGLIAASMQLHAAVDQLPADYANGEPRFSNILQMLDRVIEEGRYKLQGLRSPDAHITSIGEALAAVPNDLGLSSAADFRVVIHGRERGLQAGLLDDVYHIGREAIINACRHSQATEIETEIEYRSSELRIAVRDNGRGIDSQKLQWGRNGHWGLQGMRERADRIGARLRLWSKAALGTEIELRVPGRVAFEQAAVATAR